MKETFGAEQCFQARHVECEQCCWYKKETVIVHICLLVFFFLNILEFKGYSLSQFYCLDKSKSTIHKIIVGLIASWFVAKKGEHFLKDGSRRNLRL